jgi:hypothetical protein
VTIDDDIRRCKEAERALHERIQEARDVQRELDETVQAIHSAVGTLLEAAVEKQMTVFNDSVLKAIEHATERVYARFDRITQVLMGEENWQRRQGLPSISELVEQVEAKREGQVPRGAGNRRAPRDPERT